MKKSTTYLTEGEIIRFDERDTVFSREVLAAGSPEETAYHAAHPDLKEIDRRLARFIEAKMEDTPGADRFARAVYEALFIPSAAMALPDMVDGAPAPGKAGMSPREAARKVKEFARSLGADDVRTGPLRTEWVYSHRGSRPFFSEGYVNPPYFSGIPDGYQGKAYGDPIELDHPGAISLAFRQSRDLIATGTSRAVDYEVGAVYSRSVVASVQLARFIRALGYRARAHHLRNYLVMVVPVAVDAGIGELGRCGYIVSRSLGANFRLSAVTTDLPMEYDGPVDIGMQDFCGKCGKCAENCPSGAIPEGEKILVRGVRKWKIDPEKCLLYWGRAGYTCSICQAVCPWTKPRNFFHRTVAWTAVHLPWIRRALVVGDDIIYGKKFRPRRQPGWFEDA